MMHAMPPALRLLDFASNVHSQTGEDGVIAKVLEIIGERDRWCVEFGAWDGEHLSNTRRLIDEEGYAAVLIEGDARRHRLLADRSRGREKIIPVHAMVGFGPSDGLDSILKRTPIPRDFDLLSIDIDGNDHHAWNAVSAYAPKVVCIEFNPTVPVDLEFVQPADPAVSQGASLRSMVELGRRKGYELVAATAFNAIFVQRRLFPRFGIEDNRPETLWEDRSEVTHIFCGFDGTIHLVGGGRMPWHNIRLSAMVRRLPRFLRRHPGRYGLFGRASIVAYRWFTRAFRGG